MAEETRVEKEIKVSIPMLPDMELAVSSLATALANSINLKPDKVDEIKMAIIEACLNSFEHSKSNDQMVHVRFLVKPKELEITVRDNGHGFDPSKIKKPDIAKKMTDPSEGKRGWGLQIIESLMDSVNIESSVNGTRIIMTKRRD